MTDTLLFATRNMNKVRELEDILSNSDINLNLITNFDITNAPHYVEYGTDFLERATEKAHYLAKYSSMPTLVDASGLMVDALNGAPALSADRFDGKIFQDNGNNARLLSELGGVPMEKRTAHLHTTLVLTWPGLHQEDLIAEGDLDGHILLYPQGEDNYGYDSLFYVDSEGKTLGEMSISEKNKISHRGKAMTMMTTQLPHWWQETSLMQV